MGLSVDSIPCLKAWADSLGGITYPLLSDFYPHGKVGHAYGVLRADGTTERAIFVIDKLGVIRYIDIHDIDQQPDNEELFAFLEKLNAGSALSSANRFAPPRPAAPVASEEPQADVVMYCNQWCPDCRRAREYFRQKGVQFVEVDISRDRAAAERIRSWNNGTQVTPTFKIKGEVVFDFKRERLDQLLQ